MANLYYNYDNYANYTDINENYISNKNENETLIDTYPESNIITEHFKLGGLAKGAGKVALPAGKTALNVVKKNPKLALGAGAVALGGTALAANAAYNKHKKEDIDFKIVSITAASDDPESDIYIINFNNSKNITISIKDTITLIDINKNSSNPYIINEVTDNNNINIVIDSEFNNTPDYYINFKLNTKFGTQLGESASGAAKRTGKALGSAAGAAGDAVGKGVFDLISGLTGLDESTIKMIGGIILLIFCLLIIYKIIRFII